MRQLDTLHRFFLFIQKATLLVIVRLAEPGVNGCRLLTFKTNMLKKSSAANEPDTAVADAVVQDSS